MASSASSTESARVVGRLAPTPSGHLHLGNALAFGAAWLSVRSAGGQLLLRIEDVDPGRARTEIADAQRRDLAWLGLDWDREVALQSARDYDPWLERLAPRTYHCTCSRAQLHELEGRCACADQAHPSGSVRFRLEKGQRPIEDRGFGERSVDATSVFPDPVLRRRDGVDAYNLAVVADDLFDGVTEVVRGGDLLDFAAVQEQIWEAFGATPPSWMHTPTLLGSDGRKLSKSHGSTEIRGLREAGWSPERIWTRMLPWLGLDAENLADGLEGWPRRRSWAKRPTVVVADR